MTLGSAQLKSFPHDREIGYKMLNLLYFGITWNVEDANKVKQPRLKLNIVF